MEKMIDYSTPVGEIVANDFRTAEVFTRAGIDFCCGGRKSLQETCRENNLDIETIGYQLSETMASPVKSSMDFKAWALDFLCDYIVNTHHRYVLKTLPELVYYTQKIASVHGANHPELIEVASLFGQINQELLQHLAHEEEDLFPAIKRMLASPGETDRMIIRSEIDRMQGEHDFAGGAMDEINRITGGYILPEDACRTYDVALKLLKGFEEDLHIHVHLENNILFPKAYQL